MKQKKFDWVLRLVRFNESNEEIITYEDLLGFTRSEAMEFANDYAGVFDSVRAIFFSSLFRLF